MTWKDPCIIPVLRSAHIPHATSDVIGSDDRCLLVCVVVSDSGLYGSRSAQTTSPSCYFHNKTLLSDYHCRRPQSRKTFRLAMKHCALAVYCEKCDFNRNAIKILFFTKKTVLCRHRAVSYHMRNAKDIVYGTGGCMHKSVQWMI